MLAAGLLYHSRTACIKSNVLNSELLNTDRQVGARFGPLFNFKGLATAFRAPAKCNKAVLAPSLDSSQFLYAMTEQKSRNRLQMIFFPLEKSEGMKV